MTAVKKVLVVGGGCAGTCAAIQLRKAGVAVDLVEQSTDWDSYGAKISIGGASLRALAAVGVLSEVLRLGQGTDGVEIYAPHGLLLASMPTPRLAGGAVPGSAGIMRPVLAAILAEATRRSGTTVRLGTTFRSIEQTADNVQVTFTDGPAASYDLVVGADGLHSATRKVVLPEAPTPKYTGQAVWRAVLRRPAEVKRARMYMGPRTKVGFNPVSADEMYLFVTEERPTNERVPPEQFEPLLSALLAPFPAGVIQTARAALGSPGARIVYRPLEGLLVPLPWYRGRVVLIGDAVHATTPHLAAGAGIGIEDAIVLAEEIARGASVTGALEAFQARRWERCRMVVENSGRLGEIEATGGSQEEHGRIMQESLIALAMPI